jgi:glycerol-3-phosphate acyltransferase PlsY
VKELQTGYGLKDDGIVGDDTIKLLNTGFADRVFAVLSPALAFVGVAVFLVVAGRTRVPALGSLGGIASATAYAFATGAPTSVELTALATTLLLVYTHRRNLARLITS